MPAPLEEQPSGDFGSVVGSSVPVSEASHMGMPSDAPLPADAASIPDASSPLDHPLVVALRRFLLKTKLGGSSDVETAFSTAALNAHRAVESRSLGNHDEGAQQAQELESQLSDLPRSADSHETELAAIFDAVAEGSEGASDAYLMDTEDVEEVVLAHLCAYPEVLASVLMRAPIRQVALGQNMLNREDRRLDTEAAERHMAPRFAAHQELVNRIASEACEHMQQRSEAIAAKLLRRLDLDKDGLVSRAEFLRAAPHSLAIEIENVVLSAGVQTLMNDPGYADDFHMAMAHAMGLDKDPSGGGA